MTRQEAKLAGERYYDTGKPCKHGHFPAVRRVSTTGCLACEKANNDVHYANNRARWRENNRKAVARYHAKHTEEAAIYAANRRAANLGEFRQKDREAKKVWYAANTEEARARARKYAQDHPEANKVRAAKWRQANPERVKQLSEKARERRKERWIEFLERERQRYLKNYGADPGKYTAKGAARRAAKLQATPAWCDLTTIADIYRRAQQLTLETGINHDVDHIVPLRGKNVWGLHIPINLQILTSTANRRKFNKHG
jgi:hypothetical protein